MYLVSGIDIGLNMFICYIKYIEVNITLHSLYHLHHTRTCSALLNMLAHSSAVTKLKLESRTCLSALTKGIPYGEMISQYSTP